MHYDVSTILAALCIAGVCFLLCSVGLGVLVVAWGSYVAWGIPVSVVVTTFYLGWRPIAWGWPWRRANPTGGSPIQ